MNRILTQLNCILEHSINKLIVTKRKLYKYHGIFLNKLELIWNCKINHYYFSNILTKHFYQCLDELKLLQPIAAL